MTDASPPLLRRVAALERLRARPRRLLAVFAHPDDEAYGCAGALARAGADPQAAAVLLCLTNGEASTVLAGEGLSRTEIAAMRTRRLEQVAARVGLDGLLLPGLPDGRLSRVDLGTLGRTVAEVVRALDPQVVIAHDPRGVNGHPDHVAAHWAVRRALEGTTRRRLAMIVYLQEAAEALKPRLLFPTPEAEVDVVLDLSEAEIAAKEDCLRIHDALVTLRAEQAEGLLFRPPVERYDLLGEDRTPPLHDLFAD